MGVFEEGFPAQSNCRSGHVRTRSIADERYYRAGKGYFAVLTGPESKLYSLHEFLIPR